MIITTLTCSDDGDLVVTHRSLSFIINKMQENPSVFKQGKLGSGGFVVLFSSPELAQSKLFGYRDVRRTCGRPRRPSIREKQGNLVATLAQPSSETHGYFITLPETELMTSQM